MIASSRHVLITGTSSGIGRSTALLLDRLGYSVLAGVRSHSDADRLARATSDRLIPFIMDVCDPDSIAAARERVETQLAGKKLLGIVNNAATTVTMPLEFVDIAALRGQFDVNVFGPAAVTAAMLPLLERPGGRLVNVSSGAGRIVTPLIGAYCASKYALVAMSDALRVELRGQGISVSIIEPGFIDTPMHEKNDAQLHAMIESLPEAAVDRYGRAFERLKAVNERMSKSAAPPEDVADAIHRALSDRRPRSRYPVTREAKLLAVIGPFLTNRMRDAIFGRIVGL